MLSGTGNEGLDAGRKQYVDLPEAGIIDPTKVVHAVSSSQQQLMPNLQG
jgi:chaperonin GroEL (HSP60 family)